MMGNSQLKLWAREPLLHFLLAGLAIFLFFAWRGFDADPASRSIVIDQAQVTRLGKSFQNSFQRSPNAQEIDGLIREYIKEEVYYREAMRLGLDSDDPVIRQRMRNKMEFLARAKVESVTPDDAVLQKMLDKNPAKYASDTAYSFDQIYLSAFDPDIAGAKAEAILAKVKSSDSWQTFSEPLSVPASMENTPRSDIAKIFGEQFADELSRLSAAPKNIWAGPIGSGFGIHLLRVRAVSAARKPQLADVRQQVENDWRAATMNAREAKAYQALLSAYDIEIVRP